MTLFLRDKNNNSIVDIDFYKKSGERGDYLELSSGIIIKHYSNFLLNNLERQDEIIETFDNISELRGWLWEVHFLGRQNTADSQEYDEVLEALRAMLKTVANKFNLCYVED